MKLIIQPDAGIAPILTAIKRAKKSIDILRNRLGHLPALHDFLRFESVDPIVLATKLGNYPALVEKLFKEDTGLDESELAMLSLLSCWVFPARRAHEMLLLQRLLHDVSVTVGEAQAAFVDRRHGRLDRGAVAEPGGERADREPEHERHKHPIGAASPHRRRDRGLRLVAQRGFRKR